MIKVQKKNFNLEDEIKIIKDKYTNVGAVSTFDGYVRDFNNGNDVEYIDLDVYNEMATKELSKLKIQAISKFALILMSFSSKIHFPDSKYTYPRRKLYA